MSHTPGPWRTEECSGGGLLVIRDHPVSGSQTHLQIFPVDDARLIAAAPELLTALMALRSFMWKEGYADQTPAMAKADVAIYNATGGTE